VTDAWLAMGRGVVLWGVLLLAGAAATTWVAPARALRAPVRLAGLLLLLGLGVQLVGQLRAFDAFLPDADPLAETLAMIASTGWARNRLVLGAVAVLALIAAPLVRARSALDWSVRGLAVLALGVLPRMGHAAAVDDGVVRAYLLALLHAGAASLWLGTLAMLARGWWLEVQPLRDAITRYGRLALVAAPLTLVSGVVTAWPRFGSVFAVLESPYGQLLAVKALLVAVVLGLGAQHHRRLVRGGDAPTRGTLLAEVALAVVVLTLTGWLAETAPPAS